MKNQLAGIGIFALIAFQREVEQPQSRAGDDEQHRHREPTEPGPF